LPDSGATPLSGFAPPGRTELAYATHHPRCGRYEHVVENA
jgi:hypothetical protein